MIMPTKHVPLDNSFLGAGAVVLSLLSTPITVTEAWEKVKSLPEIGSYSRFILVLDLLYAINTIEIHSGLLVRNGRHD